MTDEVGGYFRLGVTITLSASLIVVVLNLVAMSQSVLSTQQASLQSGIDQVGLTEFTRSDQSKIGGNDVMTSISLYEGRDIAIVVRTRMCIAGTNGAPYAYNYNTILTPATIDNANDSGPVYRITAALTKSTGDSFYTSEIQMLNGQTVTNLNKKGTTQTGDTEQIIPSARFRAELIKSATGQIIGIMYTQL